MSNFEVGLIKQYVSEIESFGVRALSEENVSTSVASVVEKAIEHFRLLRDPQANLDAFKGQLKLAADLVHSSQLAKKQTLLNAAEMCPNSL